MKYNYLHIRLLSFLVCLLLFSCNLKEKQHSEKRKKTNIVFILADDMGYGDLGCYGQKLIHTPNIDQMAANGMLFTQFYAGCPVCAPSRSVLLTGLHTGHTPIRGNKRVKGGQWPLPDTVTTLASVLKKAGYVTGAFGKWGLGPVRSTGDPARQGFDTFFGYINQTLAHNYYPDHLWENDTSIHYSNTPSHQVDYSADLIQKKALQFIAQYKDTSFFLFLPYTLPHAALQVPDDSIFENYKKQFHEQAVFVPQKWNGAGLEPQPYPHAAYAAMVTRLDHYVGQILKKLKALHLEKNTLIIFTSDNGPHHEGGNDPSYFNSNGPFRGIKRDVYEGGIREPMIAYQPGKIKAGTTSGYIGAFWDFMPTLAGIANTPVPKHIDGISFLPVLYGQNDQKQHSYLYWEFHEEGGKQAVRMGKWKAVRLHVIKDPNGPIELYNLDKDTSETHNIAKKYPYMVSKMDSIMAAAHIENEAFPFK